MLTITTLGGMPVPLPTRLTAESLPHVEQLDPYVSLRLQSISFFLFVFVICVVCVRWLWNTAVGKESSQPSISYAQACALTATWGLGSIVVLTMISGARELMTPGAWQQEGWTYRLRVHKDLSASDDLAARRSALERLRVELLKFAATHNGSYPSEKAIVDTDYWQIPHYAGHQFMLVAGRTAETDRARIVVMEPELSDERLVLLSNGMIGTMRTPEIQQVLNHGK